MDPNEVVQSDSIQAIVLDVLNSESEADTSLLAQCLWTLREARAERRARPRNDPENWIKDVHLGTACRRRRKIVDRNSHHLADDVVRPDRGVPERREEDDAEISFDDLGLRLGRPSRGREQEPAQKGQTPAPPGPRHRRLLSSHLARLIYILKISTPRWCIGPAGR